MQVCNKCGIEKPFSEFHKKSGTTIGYNYTCRLCYNQHRITRRMKGQELSYDQKIRLKALLVLGGCCTRCGFSDERALQVDHVYGGGRLERKRLGGHRAVFRKIVAGNTDGYQALCANCNWIKRSENRESGVNYSQSCMRSPSFGTD